MYLFRILQSWCNTCIHHGDKNGPPESSWHLRCRHPTLIHIQPTKGFSSDKKVSNMLGWLSASAISSWIPFKLLDCHHSHGWGPKQQCKHWVSAIAQFSLPAACTSLCRRALRFGHWHPDAIELQTMQDHKHAQQHQTKGYCICTTKEAGSTKSLRKQKVKALIKISNHQNHAANAASC